MEFATLSNIDLMIAEIQGKVTVTRLPTVKPKKSDLVMSRIGGAKTRFYAATGSGRNGREQRISNRLAQK